MSQLQIESGQPHAIKPVNPSYPFFEFAELGSGEHKDFVSSAMRTAPGQ
jgi:hypothetical protein